MTWAVDVVNGLQGGDIIRATMPDGSAFVGVWQPVSDSAELGQVGWLVHDVEGFLFDWVIFATTPVELVERAAATANGCEYCGRPGCSWSRHPAAVQDVRLDQAGRLPGWEAWRPDPEHVEGVEG